MILSSYKYCVAPWLRAGRTNVPFIIVSLKETDLIFMSYQEYSVMNYRMGPTTMNI